MAVFKGTNHVRKTKLQADCQRSDYLKQDTEHYLVFACKEFYFLPIYRQNYGNLTLFWQVAVSINVNIKGDTNQENNKHTNQNVFRANKFILSN